MGVGVGGEELKKKSRMEGSGWPGLVKIEIVSERGSGRFHSSSEFPPAATSKGRGGRHHMKRKKRVAKYKLYGVEATMKNSIRKGIYWLKKRCSQIIHGY